MKLVFCGTPAFAVPTLKQALRAGHDVPLVITQPDRPVGRKQKLTPPPVKIVSLEAVDFAELYEQCAPSQQRLLKALAHAPETQVYSHEFLHRVDVANANAVRKAIDVLSRRELVRLTPLGWNVANPFFRSWLTA